MADFVGAVDQGTTSTRFMVFDHSGAEVARHQLEHTQVLPRAGWVEHNPVEIWERTCAVIKTVLNTQDLRQYLASHRRVWLVTDLGKYFRQVPVQMRQLILSQFHEVSEGYGAALYLYGG